MRQILLLLVCAHTTLSCSHDLSERGDFHILPSPQKMKISGQSNIGLKGKLSYNPQVNINPSILPDFLGPYSEDNAQVTISIDTSLQLGAEGYQLKIDENQVLITGKDKVGAYYGLMTLSQVRDDAIAQNVNLPIVEIEDFPMLAYRAIHIDVKHHMEKMDYYYSLMDRLAEYKVNGVILEIEDKLQFKRQPSVSSPDALPKEEWRKLSDYANERNIEISPLVQGLGHASFILKHEEYKALRDDPGSDWAFNPLDERTYVVQYDLYLDALEAFPHGRYLHVGGDEVHTSGRGSGKSALELQLGWLSKVSEFAEKYGRTPIFWDDMPIKHAGLYRPMFDRNISKGSVDSLWAANEEKLTEFVDLFPKNCVYMRWNYQTPETYGNLRAMDWFSENGFQVMGATAGQTRWSLMPQNESNIDNIRSFALSSIDRELDGLLLTLWDDDSPHFELYGRGIAAFAEYVWAGGKREKAEVKKVYRQRTFGSELQDTSSAFIDMLEGPVAFWKNALLEEGEQRNGLRKYDNPVEEAVLRLPNADEKGKWSEVHNERLNRAHEHLAKTEEVARKIELALENADRNQYTLQVYQQVNELVKFSLDALVRMEQYDLASPEQEALTLERVKSLPAEFEALRVRLASVYGKIRILNKPDDYVLDQDHHLHNANQSRNFDWQVYPEMLMVEKIKTKLP